MRRSALLATAVAASLCGGAAANAQQAPFDSVVVFGDSLSDNGNISIASGSPVRVRFTTNPGLVAMEGVAAHYGIPLNPSLAAGTDFAYGGAGVVTNSPHTPSFVPTISTQITGYLGAHSSLDPHALYSVWGGANDLLYHVTAAGAAQTAQALIAANTSPSNPPAVNAAIAAQIVAQVQAQAGVAALETPDQAGTAVVSAAQQEVTLIGSMLKAGAAHIVVFNLPDVGTTPGAVAQGPTVAAAFTQLASAYDNQLNNGLSGVSGVVPVNTFALIHEIETNPSRFGFTNVTTPACTTSTSISCTPATLRDPNAASTYLFADNIHPTTAAHAELAQVVISELTAPGQMSMLAETPLAFLGAQRAVIGDQLMIDDGAHAGQGVRLFANIGAGERKLDGDLNAPGSKSDNRLLTVGVDWRSDAGLSVGAALTGGESRTRLAGGVGGFRTRELTGSIFGQYRFGGSWVGAIGGFGGADYHDISRSFAIGPATRTETAGGSGSDAVIGVSAGHWFDLGSLRTGPFAAFDYAQVKVNQINEAGSDSTAMWFGAMTREAEIARLGWKLTGTWGAGAMSVYPTVAVAYGHDFDARQQTVTAGLITMNGQFDMPGYTPDKDWGEAHVGLHADFGGGFHGQIAYDGVFGGRARSNYGSVGVSYSF